uniref:Transcriptional protein SWT1 n=1 Tax=Cacopsylla melanoneura TaxID=428564 RepID=A0A8D8R784_9HEMI
MVHLFRITLYTGFQLSSCSIGHIIIYFWLLCKTTVASDSNGTFSTGIQQKRKLDDKTVPQKRPRIVLFDEDECETSSMNSSPTTSSPRSIREPVVIKTFTTPQPRDEQRRKYGNSRGRGWNQRPYDQYQQGGNNPNIKRGQSTRTPAQNRLLRIQSSLTSPRPSSPNRHHNTSQQTWRQNDSNFQRQNVSHTSPRNNVQNPESRQSDIRSEMGFSRPNSTWDSPRFKNAGPRSRSNSQSSDMSVDSGSSPRHRPVISTPVSASTQVQADQDTMEWEDIPTAVIVETVAEVRQSVTPSKAGFRIPSSSGHPPTRTTQNRSSLIVVLDTNVFLSSMEFVSRARDYMTREYAYPTLFIPWQVVQELDSLKDRSSGTRSLKQRAMAAIRFIETNLRSKHPRIVFQDQDSMERSQDFLRHECNDDRILSACLQLIPVLDQVGIKSMVLVSEDVNMRNKALINNLNSLSVLELEGVIFQGKPMRNIPTPSRPLSEEDIQLGDAFCSLKSKLFDVMSQILIDVLTRKMSPLPWEKGVFHKQPWDWKKLWSNYDKHWVSFEEEVAGYNVRYRLKGLKDIILNHERESRVTTEILRSFREEVSSFTRILKHPLIEDLIAEVHRVRQSGISSPSANHTSSAANHSHPSANHSRPSANYTSPSSNYTSPSPNYTSPSANYTSSAANHKRPSANYTIPSSNYTSPSPSHTSPSPNHTSPSPSPNQEARSRVNRSVYCESNPGPSTTESSITIKQESSGSKSAKPNESKLAAVFNKIERVFKSIEIFRVNVFRFLDLDPGQIFYPEDHSTITDLDLKNVFKKYHTCICMLKSCLEEIYEAPPSSLKSDSFLLVHLLNVLNKNDPEPLSIEDLAVAFNDQNFYTTMKAGIEQIVKLFTQYKLIYPAVQCHLQ